MTDQKNKTIDQILEEVKEYNEEALAEDKAIKDLEATYIDDEIIVDGTLDSAAAMQMYQRKKMATELLKMQRRTQIGTAYSKKVQFIHAKPTPTLNDTDPKRVAVYARVSTKSIDQTSSIENQMRYYKDKIAKNPNWELVEIYKDEGKSGTSKKGRTEFQRMLNDAHNGEFDLILCASVSRFARNVADFLEVITNLKIKNPSHPVGVYFETENVYTLDERDADKLDLQAMFADWESRNKSRRQILSIDQRIFTCQFQVADLLGYRHTRTGKLVMIPEEAKTVRLIFLAYFCGYSFKEIADILTDKARPTLKGNTVWNPSMVKNIMLNERRWGHLQARKNIVTDYRKKKVVKNNGLREGAFVPDHHVGIVSPEIAKAVSFLFHNGTMLNGVQDIKVIHEGNLKGFINVNPYWGAVDNSTFLDICAGAYETEELERIKYESQILSGEEHSKVLSMDFSDYEIPYGIYFLNAAMPSLTLTKNSIKFNKACFRKMNECSHIELLYHPIYQAIAIRACAEDSPTGLRWKKDSGEFRNRFRVDAFMSALYEKMNWVDELTFKFRGIYRERGNSQILFFSLDEPRIYLPKSRIKPESDEDADSEAETIRYIKYKKDDAELLTDIPDIAYPLEWQKCFGLSRSMRERRDWITDTITEADIQTDGTSALNPKIGEIPSKEQAMAELESLLIEM